MEFVAPPVPVGCSGVRRDFRADGFRPVFCARRPGATGSLLCYSCGPARTRVRSSAYSIHRPVAEAPLLRATVSLLKSLRRVLKIKHGFRSAANVSVTFSKFSWFFFGRLYGHNSNNKNTYEYRFRSCCVNLAILIHFRLSSIFDCTGLFFKLLQSETQLALTSSSFKYLFISFFKPVCLIPPTRLGELQKLASSRSCLSLRQLL